jgi:undecaprenyl-diphosphatase
MQSYFIQACGMVMRDFMSIYLDRIHAADVAWCLRFNRTSRRHSVQRVFCLVSRLGDGVFWYAVMLGILLAQHEEGVLPCVHMVLAGLAGTLTYKIIKGQASRPRPHEVSQSIFLGIPPLDRFSFPSGHTLHAVVFTTVALAYYPMLAWLLLPFTLLVAASRLVLGLHYPTDVLAGAVMGALIARISFML